MVASGGDAGVEWRPAATSTGVPRGRRAGRDVWRGWLVHHVESFELTTPPTLPVDDSVGYSLSKSIYDLRTSTRAPYVSAAPVRGRKVLYPGGCTARPGTLKNY